MADLTLLGYRYSVYTRVVRMVLAEKAQSATYVETDPFADDAVPELQTVNPFHRVPVLMDGAFTLYETSAITRYLDMLCPTPALVPTDLHAVARMLQIISLVDSEVYPVLVRKVYSHAVFRPSFGEASDPDVLAAGLQAAPTILSVLDGLMTDLSRLTSMSVSLADFHLAPMLAAFASAPQSRQLLAGHPRLSDWLDRMAQRPCFAATIQALPAP